MTNYWGFFCSSVLSVKNLSITMPLQEGRKYTIYNIYSQYLYSMYCYLDMNCLKMIDIEKHMIPNQCVGFNAAFNNVVVYITASHLSAQGDAIRKCLPLWKEC